MHVKMALVIIIADETFPTLTTNKILLIVGRVYSFDMVSPVSICTELHVTVLTRNSWWQVDLYVYFALTLVGKYLRAVWAGKPIFWFQMSFVNVSCVFVFTRKILPAKIT